MWSTAGIFKVNLFFELRDACSLVLFYSNNNKNNNDQYFDASVTQNTMHKNAQYKIMFTLIINKIQKY